jgi:hypothetical protein
MKQKHGMSPEDQMVDDRMDIYKNAKPAIMSICHLNFGAWHFILNLVRNTESTKGNRNIRREGKSHY